MCFLCRVIRTFSQLIRIENNVKMNHIALRVASRANDDSRGHIKDKEFRALRLYREDKAVSDINSLC